MINNILQSAVDEFCRPHLVEGQLYQFKLNGYMCSGLYLGADDRTDEGAFYCNGKAICQVSQAVQIKHMLDSGIHSTHVMYRYFDETLLREVMLIIHNAVEAICTDAPKRKQDEALENLVNAHGAIYDRLAQTQGESNDSLQTSYSCLSAPAKPSMVPNEQAEDIKANERTLCAIIINRITIPWDVERSIRSIERRIQTAITVRDFAKAARLNNVSIAIRNVHNHCQELLNATR